MSGSVFLTQTRKRNPAEAIGLLKKENTRLCTFIFGDMQRIPGDPWELVAGLVR